MMQFILCTIDWVFKETLPVMFDRLHFCGKRILKTDSIHPKLHFPCKLIYTVIL